MNICRLVNMNVIKKNKTTSLIVLIQLITVFALVSDVWGETVNKIFQM